MNYQASTLRKAAFQDDYVVRYWRDGFAVVRGFFSPAEVQCIASASDRLYEEGLRHGRCFRHGNLFYNVAADAEGARFTRMVSGHPITSRCSIRCGSTGGWRGCWSP